MIWDVKFTGTLKEDGARVYVIFGIEGTEQPTDAAKQARLLLNDEDTWFDDDDEPVQFSPEELNDADGIQNLIDIDPAITVSRTISFTVSPEVLDDAKIRRSS